jgi:hypothetical protein
MNVHVINRAQAWRTARPFITADDLVIWTDTAGIGSLSVELEVAGLKIVRLASAEVTSNEDINFPVISDQAWVQSVLDSTTLCSWG